MKKLKNQLEATEKELKDQKVQNPSVLHIPIKTCNIVIITIQKQLSCMQRV